MRIVCSPVALAPSAVRGTLLLSLLVWVFVRAGAAAGSGGRGGPLGLRGRLGSGRCGWGEPGRLGRLTCNASPLWNLGLRLLMCWRALCPVRARGPLLCVGGKGFTRLGRDSIVADRAWFN
jgi:hypothetical protein